MQSMASAHLQTNITHSNMWLWCRAKVPINSKSGSWTVADRREWAFGNVTVSLSAERSTAAGSAHPLIVKASSGHSSTIPHTSQNWRGVPHSTPGHEVAPEVWFQIPTWSATTQIVLKTQICFWKRNMVAVGWKPCTIPYVSFSGS